MKKMKNKKTIYKKPSILQPGGIWLTLFMLLACFSEGEAQTLKRQCVASTGSYMSENGTTIQQTVGQPYGTTSYYSNTIRYNPGFLQPVFRIENIKSSINATIFPNPTTNQITIETTIVLENVIVQIVDINGKLVLNKKLNELKSYTIDCSSWSSGAYLISLSDSKNNLYSSKLIISR